VSGQPSKTGRARRKTYNIRCAHVPSALVRCSEEPVFVAGEPPNCKGQQTTAGA